MNIMPCFTCMNFEYKAFLGSLCPLAASNVRKYKTFFFFSFSQIYLWMVLMALSHTRVKLSLTQGSKMELILTYSSYSWVKG